MNIIQQLKDAEGNNIYPIGYSVGGVKMDLLWTNASPDSDFAAQSLSIDFSSYQLVLIYWHTFMGKDSYATTPLIIKNKTTRAMSHRPSASDDMQYGVRRTVLFDDSTITFSTGWDNNGSTAAALIPYQIYGIKAAWIVPTSVHGLQYVEV